MSTDPAPNLVVGDCRSTGSRPQTIDYQSFEYRRRHTKIVHSRAPSCCAQIWCPFGAARCFWIPIKGLPGAEHGAQGGPAGTQRAQLGAQGGPAGTQKLCTAAGTHAVHKFGVFFEGLWQPKGPKRHLFWPTVKCARGNVRLYSQQH